MKIGSLCIKKQYHVSASIYGFFIIMILSPTLVFGQLTARGLGMGGAYTALARGVHAPEWNPANLGLPDNPKFSMSIFAIGTAINNNSFSLGDYNKYFTMEKWNSNDIQEILDHIRAGGKWKADSIGTIHNSNEFYGFNNTPARYEIVESERFKKGEPVLVWDGLSGEHNPSIKVFSHMDGDYYMCFNCNKTEGETTPWMYCKPYVNPYEQEGMNNE